MRTAPRLWLLLAWLLASLSACAPSGDLAAAGDDMRTYLDGCTRAFGYAPADSDRLGAHELAPREREWRSCAYRGIEQIVMPAARAPGSFRTLIDTDRRLTDEVAAGTLTRAERRQRLEGLLDQALAREVELEREAEQRSQRPPGYAISGATSTFNAQQAQIRTVARGLR